MIKMKLLLIACVLTSVYGSSPRVRIKEGGLVGTTYTLPNDRKVYAFLGIPYTAPPIGNDRFKDPKPPKPWTGSRNATSEGNACLQIRHLPGQRNTEVTGDEDCLFLNVFTPRLPKNKGEDELMNVLVYFHGGGFMMGTGNKAYPDYILQDDDIVYVSLNYRLGILGFFSANHPSAPGNYGLKDQVEALRWVKRNIRAFGGDPNKVTIYGNSAGGASVHYHLLSPLNKDHFQSAISSSGSVSLPWSLPTYTVENSEKVASAFNCSYENVERMMACLRNKPANELIEEGSPFKNGVYRGALFFGPVIEPKHRGAFLTENPYRLLKDGKVKQVPFLTSLVETEGSVVGLEIVSNDKLMEQWNHYWDVMAPKLFFYSHLRSKSKQNYISSSIKKHYFGGENLSNQTTSEFLQALGDRYFYSGVIETTKLHSSASYENTYCFKLFYRGTESVSDFYPNNNGKNYGVCHTDDIVYVLKSYNGNKKNKNDKDMSKLLCSSIIAFMKQGNPRTQKIRWEPIYKNGTMNCLVIYSSTYQRMEDIENRDNTRFWNDLLPQEDDPR